MINIRMNTTTKKGTNQTYNEPSIVCIKLDNDISLALQSTPPIGPDETNLRPTYLQNDPYKKQIV